VKIIDLTLPIYAGMPVYPGDPDVVVDQARTVEENEWAMKRLHINAHDGTHLNMPAHTSVDGKTLDDYDLSAFCGPCLLDTIEGGT